MYVKNADFKSQGYVETKCPLFLSSSMALFVPVLFLLF